MPYGSPAEWRWIPGWTGRDRIGDAAGQRRRVVGIADGEVAGPDFQGLLVNPDVGIAPDPTFSPVFAGLLALVWIGLDQCAMDLENRFTIMTPTRMNPSPSIAAKSRVCRYHIQATPLIRTIPIPDHIA